VTSCPVSEAKKQPDKDVTGNRHHLKGPLFCLRLAVIRLLSLEQVPSASFLASSLFSLFSQKLMTRRNDENKCCVTWCRRKKTLTTKPRALRQVVHLNDSTKEGSWNERFTFCLFLFLKYFFSILMDAAVLKSPQGVGEHFF
jgi:hypothetical protein